MSIHVLPRELIFRIFGFVDPASHLDLAVTCKQIFELSRDILNHHSRCHSLYRSCSDHNLSLFSALFRDIVTDQIAAWHVRTFEVWNALVSLKYVEDDEDDEFFPLQNKEVSRLCRFFRTETPSVALLLRRTPDVIKWDFSDEDEHLYGPCVAVFQTLLFSICPRLRSLKYVQSEVYDDNHPIHHLCNAIYRIAGSELQTPPVNPEWPQGYQSLRSIAIGPTGPYLDQNHISGTMVAPLFLLPNIETLYFRGLIFGEDEEDNEEILNNDPDFFHVAWMLRRNSSSVKHLYFDEAQCWEPIQKFIRSAKDLESAIFRNCNFHCFNNIVATLYRSQADSLRTLIYCGENDTLRGDASCYRFSPKKLSSMNVLSSVTLNPSDVRLDSFKEHRKDGQGDGEVDGLTGRVARYAKFIDFVQNVIPRSVETLVFTGFKEVPNEKDIQAFDDALARLIEEGHCTQLKSLYVEEMEADAPGATSPESLIPTPAGGWFRKTVECGRKHGVAVYTLADQGSTERCLEDICNRIFVLSHEEVAVAY